MAIDHNDYLERRQRVQDGQGSDEDRRLVKHYESQQDLSGGPVTRVPAPVGDGADGARQIGDTEDEKTDTLSGQGDQSSKDDEGRIGDSRRKQADDKARSNTKEK